MTFRRTLGLAAVLVVTALLVQPARTAPADAAKASGKIARGRYLVEDIGMCRDCHTPRDNHGQFLADKALQGSELGFKPTAPVPGWTSVAPPIAGLPNWTDEQAIKFFTTGIDPTGTPANPPMPGFRFNRSDAEAIIAYLRSVKTMAAASKKGASSN